MWITMEYLKIQIIFISDFVDIDYVFNLSKISVWYWKRNRYASFICSYQK